MIDQPAVLLTTYRCPRCGKFFHSQYKETGELEQTSALHTENAELLSCLTCYDAEMAEEFPPEDEEIPEGDFGF